MKTSFMKVRCKKCNNEQVIYTKVASNVSCLVCGEALAKPTGGTSDVGAQVLEVLD